MTRDLSSGRKFVFVPMMAALATACSSPPAGEEGPDTVGEVALPAIAPTPAPLGSGRARMDGNGHFMMAGKKVFIRGVYDTGLSYTTSESTWESMLFSSTGDRQLTGIPLNLYLNYQLGKMPI